MAETDKKDQIAQSENKSSAADSVTANSNAKIPAPAYQLGDKSEGEGEEKSKGDKKESHLSASGGDEPPFDPDQLQAIFPNVNFNFNSSVVKQMGAEGGASGMDIFFASSKPDSHVMIHELTHVLQQSGKNYEATQSVEGVEVNTNQEAEKEADDVAKKVQAGGMETLNSELGSLKSMPYKNSDDQPMQMFGWRDLTPDFIEDGLDKVGDAVGDLTDAAMEKALGLIEDAGSLLKYLAKLSGSMAKKAIVFVARRMTNLFIKFIQHAPGHELIFFGLQVLVGKYSVSELVVFLGKFTANVGKRVLRTIRGINVNTLKDIVLFLPSYALSGFVIALLRPDLILDTVLELASDKLQKLLKMAALYRVGLKKLLSVIAANIDGLYDKVKAAFVALGEEFVAKLIRGYSIMLEIVKKVVEKIWPIGAGVQLDAGIGATFGIPIYVGVNYVCYIVHQSPGVFKLFRRGVVKAGVDVGVGAGVSVGGGKKGSGGEKGQNDLMIGAEAGANVGAGLQACVMQEFEFPIYQDLAFISFLATATGTDTGAGFTLASKLLTPTGANLDPMLYNTKTQFKFGVYAEGSAEAAAGVRVGESSTNGEVQKWNNRNNTAENPNALDSKPDNLGGTSGGPWYAPGFLLRKLSASIGANISLQANAGLEMRQGKFTEDENGVRIPSEVELDLFGEGSFAASLATSLPINVPLPNFATDTTMGLKATWKFKRNGSDENIEMQYKKYSIYMNGGDMDVIDGNATENEISIEGDSSLGFEDFLKEANLSFRRKQRLSLQSGFGRAFQRRANRQEFARVLNGKGKDFGGNVAGYLTYEFELSSGNAKRLLSKMGAFYNDRIANGEWQFLIDDLITLFSSGQMAPYIEQFIDDILACLNVKMLQARWSASLGIAADGSVGAGAKVRVHGNLSAGVFRNYDLLQEGQTLTVQEIRELLLNGANAMGLSGDETKMVPAGGGGDTQVQVQSEGNDPLTEDSAEPLQLSSNSETGQPSGEKVKNEQENELSPEQEEAAASYTEDEKLELDSVKYELIAHGMAYSTILDDQQKAALKGMGLQGWVDTVNTNATTGFFAGLIMPMNENEMDLGDQLTDADREYLSQRRAVIAFRGSEMGDVGNNEGGQFAMDWLQNDMDPYAVGHTAFNLNYKDIEEMLEYAVKRSGRRVVVTGHSLGGSLAKQCALHFPQYVEQAYTYQAPGIAKEQQETLEDNAGSGKDILGRELSEEQQAKLQRWLRNEEHKEHTVDDIDFVSHTSAGDIVHNAGGGRAPGAIRRHHRPSGILNGYTPKAHTLYLTSSEEFTEQHEILNRIMGNEMGEGASAVDQANTLFDGSTRADVDVDPTRIKRNSEITDSTAHESTEGLRRGLIGNVFSPQAKLLVNNPGMIPNMPVESKIIILNNLMRGVGLNAFKKGTDLWIGNRAVVNLFVHSTGSHQIKMVNASGGIRAVYNKIDGMMNNLFSSRTDELRQAFVTGMLPIITETSAAAIILDAMDSGVLGMGDNTEEKLIADILLAQPEAKGKAILEILGDGDYDTGLKKVLRKLQGDEDSAVRQKYPLQNKRGWFR